MCNVYIIKLHPNNPKSFEVCLKNNVIGVGWRLGNGDYNTIDEYKKARKDYPKFSNEASLSLAINTFESIIENGGALLWTQSPDGEYYLCKTNGEYSYHGHDDKNNKEYIDADMINCLDCKKFHNIPPKFVPKTIMRKIEMHFTISELMGRDMELTCNLYKYEPVKKSL